MPLRKTAIALPADVLEQVDAAAKRRGESRSAFITRLLRVGLQAKRDRDITRKLDELFADPDLHDEARRVAGELDEAGSDWTDERW